MDQIKEQLGKILSKIFGASVVPEDFTSPPKNVAADLALPCFKFAKLLGENLPVLQDKIKVVDISKETNGAIKSIVVAGPYLNFIINEDYLAGIVFGGGKSVKRKKGKIMVEFAHPNTHKAFHIGHLRNIITGESVCRLLEFAGYKVIRANYQGDVGLHIAKALWGIGRLSVDYEKANISDLTGKVAFLGKAYALGGQTFEKDEAVKKEIYALNEKIYNDDPTIRDVYSETRGWSLGYFDKIYRQVGTKFDRLYFESEVFARGKELVLKFLKRGVFKESEGAIIFEGEKHELHSRVFVNSLGFPTYEAKDLALAEKQFKEFKPERIIHVVGKEQTDYFKVLFKSLEFVLPESKGKEEHLAYGWVSLKSGKMSSRTGQVVLGEWLIDEVEKKIAEIMKDSQLKNKEEIRSKVTMAAVKYAMLKLGVNVDMAFDINESVNVAGDSGPYLLYIVARIKSILKKSKISRRDPVGTKCKIDVKNKGVKNNSVELPTAIHPAEKALLAYLCEFEDVAGRAAQALDPSLVAKYLFELAQCFNNFYHECPVLKAESEVLVFRLRLIQEVAAIMENGLRLLGIETIAEM